MANFTDAFDPEKTTEDVARRLENRFPDHDAAELHEVAAQTVEELADSPVKGFIEPIAEHEASERVRHSDDAPASAE